MFELFSYHVVILCFALLLDRLIGEPTGWHPLIVFGRWVDYCKKLLTTQKVKFTASQKRKFDSSLDSSLGTLSGTVIDNGFERFIGVLAWLLAVAPILFCVSVLFTFLPSLFTHILSVVIVYFCIGWQSLREHGFDIFNPLQQGDLQQAKNAVAKIVSRDTDSLNEEGITKASVESILENGSDAIFAPIFWFLILGVPGILLYRLANTLDAMWGYKNDEYLYFGWCAARLDDLLNYFPARLVILTYALCGNFSHAIKAARKPEASWKSPNAGPVMAAGAGALGITLGGKAYYFGEEENRPTLGYPQTTDIKKPLTSYDLKRAINLVDRGVFLWLGVVIACVMYL